MVRWLGLLAFAAFSTCAPAFAADCTVTETIHTPDGLPAKGVRVEFIALAPQTVGTLISSKAVVGTTDASGVLRDAAGAVGVTFTQGAIVRVQAPDLGLKGQKILVPNTTSATLHALVASYMTPGTAPAVDDATDLVMGVNDNGLVTITTGETIAAAIEAINQAALPGTLTIQKAGSTVASRATLNIIDGSNVTTTVADDAGNSRVNITVASSGGGGGGGGLSDGDYGDVVVGGSGTTLTIDANAISYAKFQHVSATDKLLGRSSSGAGDVEEISCGSACRNLLDDSDAPTMRLTLGLDTAALQPSSAFEVPLTFSTGLTRSTNTVTVNSTQLISRLSNLSTNGFVKTGSANGTLSIDTSTYLTGNQSITFTGDATGSGTTSVALTIPGDTVTNAKLADMNASTIKGNATGGATNPTDLTGTQATALLDVFTSSLKGLAPSSSGGTGTWLRADGTWTDPATFSRVNAALGAANAAISVNNVAIQNLGNPGSISDAANLGTVSGTNFVPWKKVAKVATTANITLSGAQTIDGVSVVAGDNVLVKNQTSASENGVYAAASGAWTRQSFAGDSSSLSGMVILVAQGTANADTIWTLTTDGTITVDSTSLAFAEVDHKAVLAGTGLTRTTNTLSVNSSQAISTLSGLTSNGFVKTSGGTGALGVDTSTYLTTNATITQTGDVTGSGTTAITTTIANDAVTNAKAANMANATIKCRTTAGTGDPEDCTATQATALLNAAVGDSGSGGTKGLVPAAGSGDAAAGKFLKADMTYAVPAGGSSVLWSNDYMADQMLAVGTSWPTTAMADLEVANLVNYIAYDPTTSQGRGFEIVLPSGATTITLTLDAASAASGFTSNNGVVMALDCRQQYGTGSFTQQAATAVTLTDNATIQRKTFAYTVSGLSATAGTVLLCELERLTANASDTLTQDWRVAHVGVAVN